MSPSPLPAAPVVAAPAYDPIRQGAFFMGVALVFLRFSMLHQIQTYLMGFNMRLLYLVGIPAIFGIVVAGGIPRSFRGRPAYYWLFFTLWLFPVTLFSTWRTGSAWVLLDFARTNLPLLFITAGLAVTWRDCTLLMKALAFAAAVSVATSRIFEYGYGGERLGLEFGSISNPNDLAAHLLLILPFLLWVLLSAKAVPWRILAAGFLAYGVVLVLRTGSRGALLGLIVAALFLFILGTARQRLVAVLILPFALLSLLLLVPTSAARRLVSFGLTSEKVNDEASQSSDNRIYLLRQTIRYTLQFPVFGVGPAQFASYEGRNNRIIGTHGLWFNAHNSYTQVSSECGIPGLLFFLAAIGSTFRLLFKTRKQAAALPGCGDIATALTCTLAAFAGFCTAITFLSFAYFFYLPFMGGFSICVWNAAQEEFRIRGATATPAPGPQFGPRAFPPMRILPTGSRRLAGQGLATLPTTAGVPRA